MKKNEIFLTGYAKLPEGITARELYGVVALGMTVNRETSEILDAEPTLSTYLARTFVKELLVGEKLNNIEHIENKFRHHYFGSAKKAILTAIKICYKNYKKIRGDL
ncbi:DUF3870 domain-containing protein [Clostridium sp. D2Q-11]|uniref:DUF3870 domain-containing protein n=1 Tax=Anaeromonas frigoriresistens TaxID=2683708 RepID=A0A942V001_9FIRM|nr:DUF3870 domain-containing protein [Anaeromonas frigoriresistens]MBS4537572.1 DUF3870 domain-containing protein [Anaeromonas frigoriresistens]